MKLEDVPSFFLGQYKVSKDYVIDHATMTGISGINNVFQKIDLSEIDDLLNVVLEDEEKSQIEKKTNTWNISFNGDEHQDGDRIFWFYILGNDGSRIMNTCNNRQFDVLVQNYEFVSFHDYNALDKCTGSYSALVENYSSVKELFPIFKKREA